MKEKLIELFGYNYAMNNAVIELANMHTTQLSEKIYKLISHTINAHQIWNARIIRKSEFQVWQLNNWENIPHMNSSNYNTSLEILRTENLSTLITYTNTKGDIFENKLEDILFHIINHSTYHRAQIATECRSSGIEPLMTDYIKFKREI